MFIVLYLNERYFMISWDLMLCNVENLAFGLERELKNLDDFQTSK